MYRVTAVLTTVVLVTIINAPVAWLGDWLAQNSRLRLVYANGTIWSGTAMLALSDGKQARILPHRVSWQVQWRALFAGRIAVEILHAAVDGPLRLSYDRNGINLDPGSALLPAGLLTVVGAPFNTISPGGTLVLRWDKLRMAGNGFDGEISMEWRAAQSALSPVSPLGDYRLVARANSGNGDLTLTTLSGPLILEGVGKFSEGKLQFSGTADAVPHMRASLNGLIGVLGPRSGQKVLLNWELQTG
jgi:general secretion pathway protein N